MTIRTILVVGTTLSMSVMLLGCQASGASAGGPTIQIGSTQPGFLGPPKQFRAMHPRLEAVLGERVIFNPQPDGPAIAAQLKQGQIAYAFMTAGEYCAAQCADALTPVATAKNAIGQTSRKAYIVVKAGSHLKTIADCRGKRFAFGVHGDLLTDTAVQVALEKAGVPVKELLVDIAVPFVVDGRLYMGEDVAKVIVADLTVNAGVLDEVQYNKMPDTGGSFILGPSKDQFKIVGETIAVPEMIVVAGPEADAAQTKRLKDFLLNQASKDSIICEQLGVSGFDEVDRAAYLAANAALQSGV